MKYIFDFDDVLFNNTKQFKKHIYGSLEKIGIARSVAEEYYKLVREKEFSLKDFILTLSVKKNININSSEVYKKIMRESKNFRNTKLVEKIKTLGKQNCFIITNGEEQFQKDKIQESGLAPLFSGIYIVPGSKKEIIYDICSKYKNETVFFIEDKAKFIQDIDLARCPNLKTILYTGQNI